MESSKQEKNIDNLNALLIWRKADMCTCVCMHFYNYVGKHGRSIAIHLKEWDVRFI